MIKLLRLLTVIWFIAIPGICNAQIPGGGGTVNPPVAVANSYIVDGDSHMWRQGCDREGKAGSVYGKTGIIEGFACDIAGRYKLVGNYGEGGETCKQVWNGRNATLASKAPTIILSCGHNDTLKWVPTDTTFYYIRYLTKWHKQHKRKVVWITPLLAASWGGYSVNSMNAKSKIVGEYIRNVGADCIIDAETAIRPGFHLTDKIHVNKAGGVVLAPLATKCLGK